MVRWVGAEREVKVVVDATERMRRGEVRRDRNYRKIARFFRRDEGRTG